MSNALDRCCGSCRNFKHTKGYRGWCTQSFKLGEGEEIELPLLEVEITTPACDSHTDLGSD